jgi:hypothetical protein
MNRRAKRRNALRTSTVDEEIVIEVKIFHYKDIIACECTNSICARHYVSKSNRSRTPLHSAARLLPSALVPSPKELDRALALTPDHAPRMDSFFGVKAALEALLGCGVDLVESGVVRNTYARPD